MLFSMASTLQSPATIEYPPANPDDVTLNAARNGCANAYAQLYREHLPSGIQRALLLVRNSTLAEEIASEAFVRVYDAMTRGLGPHVTFRGYYLTAVRNLTAQHMRSKAARLELPTSDIERHAPGVYDAYGDKERVARVARVQTVLSTMPPRWGAALTLANVEGQSLAQVGSAFGMSPAAAAALTYRARKAFRVAYLELEAAQDRELV